MMYQILNIDYPIQDENHSLFNFINGLSLLLIIYFQKKCISFQFKILYSNISVFLRVLNEFPKFKLIRKHIQKMNNSSSVLRFNNQTLNLFSGKKKNLELHPISDQINCLKISQVFSQIFFRTVRKCDFLSYVSTLFYQFS